jgi:hypothetical protein
VVHPCDAKEGYCARCHDWTGETEVERCARLLREAQDDPYIREIVDSAPPLTGEQKSRISALLGLGRPDLGKRP